MGELGEEVARVQYVGNRGQAISITHVRHSVRTVAHGHGSDGRLREGQPERGLETGS